MKELVELIAKALVDYPDEIQVRVTVGEEVIVLELRMKLRKRITLEILK
jgi:predicted RNA-binding protein YlqC (UPF0109 family)